MNSDTRRRIDDARDILVGKLPDPKSQIEQITIALIYKFMDDMDKEAKEMGGKITFFKGAYAKYAWSSIFDPALSGHQLVTLYAEAIQKMNQNPGIPQLFRDIFKNAYLPYNDPETLKSFLKIIDEFIYDHSEKLGDAFEYLLSIMGSQGDAGQFRTPRHIIDFIVAVVNPDKTETILDPACGTAGFLISAYKHILDNNKDKNGKSKLTADEKKRLINNFVGYDISPDMVRLSLVNMYLHGFQNPKVYEYDTLTSEDKWKDKYDVIMANPPFMSPKGGIKPHKKFSIKANRSEVLFVDYIHEHLTANGRAGIIVPEGIIFQSATAYQALRKMLVDESLYAVISLPAGIFNPYSGVKTSILLLDNSIVKKSNNILFIKISNDGFNLGAQRREIKDNDLPLALDILHEYRKAVLLGVEPQFEKYKKTIAHIVSKENIKDNEWKLSEERYKDEIIQISNWDLVELSMICEINPKKSELEHLPGDINVSFVPMSDINEFNMNFKPLQTKKLSEVIKGYTYFKENDVLLAKVTPCFENGKSGIARNLINKIGFGSSEFFVIRPNEQNLPEWIYYFISEKRFLEKGKAQMTGTGGLQRVTTHFLTTYKIPKPPIEIQEKIVKELQNYQNIIDGAKNVVENYKPIFKIENDWVLHSMSDIMLINHESAVPLELYGEDTFTYIDISSVENETGTIDFRNVISTSDAPSRAKRIVRKNDILLSTVRPNLKAFGFLNELPRNPIASTGFAVLTPKEGINSKFIYYSLFTEHVMNQMIGRMGKGSYPSINQKDVSEINVYVPPLEIQNKIVDEIEKEKTLVESNKQLIDIFTKKIEERIAEVWELE